MKITRIILDENIHIKQAIDFESEIIDMPELVLEPDNVNKTHPMTFILKYFTIITLFIGYTCAIVYIKLFINEKYNLNLLTMVKIEIIAFVLVSCITALFLPDIKEEQYYIKNSIYVTSLRILFIFILNYLVICIIIDSILIHY